MPSPNYIGPIKNVTGNANVNVCNKNMLDTSDFEIIGSELDIKRNEDGSFTINGTNTSNAVIKLKNKIKMNGNYTLIETGEKAPVSVYTTLYKNSDFSDTITFINSYSNARYKNFEANIVSLSQRILLSPGTYSNYTVKLMLVEGTFNLSNIGDYVEHQCQQFPFPLAEGQRLMKGDYLADDGIHHKRKQIVLDGTEKYFVSTLSEYQWFGLDVTGLKISTLLCNYLKYYERLGSYIGISSSNTSNRIYLSISKEITTIEQLKEYLAEQYSNGTPIVVEYDLAEEEIDPYTPEQQAVYDEIKKTAHSYGEQTHIFSTDEISPIFDVEAKADIQAMFNNLQAQILANGEV